MKSPFILGWGKGGIMSVLYCYYCHEYIDTDFNTEHFNEEGDCELQIKEEEKND